MHLNIDICFKIPKIHQLRKNHEEAEEIIHQFLDDSESRDDWFMTAGENLNYLADDLQMCIRIKETSLRGGADLRGRSPTLVCNSSELQEAG